MADYVPINTRLVKEFVEKSKGGEECAPLAAIVSEIAAYDSVAMGACVMTSLLTSVTDALSSCRCNSNGTSDAVLGSDINARSDILSEAFFVHNIKAALPSLAIYGRIEEATQICAQLTKSVVQYFTSMVRQHNVSTEIPSFSTMFPTGVPIILQPPGFNDPHSPVAQGEDESTPTESMSSSE